MSLEQFLNSDIDLSNVNKSTYQILCVPNITSSVNLDKDSYVLVMENVIKNLSKIRDDLFFHLPTILKRYDFGSICLKSGGPLHFGKNNFHSRSKSKY